MMMEFDRFINFKKSYCVEKTVIYYRDNLTAFIKYCESLDVFSVSDVTELLIERYLRYLRQKGIKNVSVITYMRSIKVFLTWLYKNKYIEVNPVLEIKLPKSDASLVNPLTCKDVRLIDDYFKCDVLGVRNYCIFHLMLDCGLRLSEVCNLNIDDVNDTFLIVNRSKNNKSRFVLCPKFVLDAIESYRYIAGKSRCKALFRLVKSDERLTDKAIKKLFYNLKRYSGVGRVHAHLLRHTFATSYICFGGNMEMLRILLGHSDYSITQNYLHLATQQQIIHNDIYKLDDIFFKTFGK